MGLEIGQGTEMGKQESSRRFRIEERLYKTKDGRIVPQGDPEANSLFKTAGATIPMKEAIELGLAEKEEESVQEKPDAKKAAKPKDKQKPAPKNKGQGGK